MAEGTKPVLQTVGNYDLLDKIADGGMGSVYKARDRNSGQIVAVKVLYPQMAKNPVLMKRFEQEYNVASKFDHPNIVKAMDFGYQGTTAFLVMEFVDGESLGQKLEREGRLPEREAINLIAQVAQGLNKAHKQGLIHRDVKPDNVLVTPEGQAKLADLGLVKELETDLNLTRTGRGLGTPHFMSPEQFRNAKSADARCDIYSLAATLYMMVTGQLPFKGLGPLDAWMKKLSNDLTTPRQLVPALSERVDWAIRRAMHPDPSQRPTTCREFVEDLTGHSTRKLNPPEAGTVQDFWYVLYKDEDGVTHTVKGTLGGIRRNLREGVMGDPHSVRASRSKGGPFEPLRNHPEFRDLTMTSAATPTTLPNVPAPPPEAPMQLETSVPTPKTPLTPTQNRRPAAPHIDMGAGEAQSEWVKWILVFLITLLLGLLGYYLIPLLTGGPR
jgi:serine/threonine protein kinase